MNSSFFENKHIIDSYLNDINNEENINNVVTIFKNHRVLAKALFLLEPQQKKIFLLQNPKLGLPKYKQFEVPNFSFEVLSKSMLEPKDKEQRKAFQAKLNTLDLLFEGIRESHNIENAEDLPEFLTSIYHESKIDISLQIEDKLCQNQLFATSGEVIFFSISWYYLLTKLSIETGSSKINLFFNKDIRTSLDKSISYIKSDSKLKILSDAFLVVLKNNNLKSEYTLFNFMRKELERRRNKLLNELKCLNIKDADYVKISSFLSTDLSTKKERQNLDYLLFEVLDIKKVTHELLLELIDKYYYFLDFLSNTIQDLTGIEYLIEYSFEEEYKSIGLKNNSLNLNSFKEYLLHLTNILTTKNLSQKCKRQLQFAKSEFEQNSGNLIAISNFHYAVLTALLFENSENSILTHNALNRLNDISRIPHTGYYFYHKILKGHFFEHYVFEIRRGLDAVFDIPKMNGKQEIKAKAFAVIVLDASENHLFKQDFNSTNKFIFENLQELKFLSEYLYSPFVDKNYYDSIVKRTEQLELFDTLFHSQKQYMRAIEALSNKLASQNQKLLNYYLESLQGFLEIISLYKKNELSKLEEQKSYISLAKEVCSIVGVFEDIIMQDLQVLSKSLQKIDYDRRRYIFNFLEAGNKIFSGNFRTIEVSKSNQIIGLIRLIFKESIVNALEHCDQKNPQITINIFEDERSYQIEIRNNSVANELDLDYMENPQLNRGKLGWYYIRYFVRKILKNWQIKVGSDDGWTWYKYIIVK